MKNNAVLVSWKLEQSFSVDFLSINVICDMCTKFKDVWIRNLSCKSSHWIFFATLAANMITAWSIDEENFPYKTVTVLTVVYKWNFVGNSEVK